ncbi:MAG: alpha/beta hydrolase [Prolixibacteraceae bacterium]|jgi:acetyl esterase/lipase|nr:alpha/beta hydrolase [Prolixibacteraceae bacterium]
MKKLITNLFFLILMSNLPAQDFSLKVWLDGAPEKNTPPGKERTWTDGIQRIENISEAELYVYLPEKEKNTGAAMVICPGGGYWIEAIEHEGYQIAEFLKENGIAGIVLKYRLPYGNHNIPLMDTQQAIRIVRSKAAEWNINPAKIGIAGSSAGGHLASTAGTHFDAGNPQASDPLAKLSCRPDFMLLLYPVVTFNEEWTHMGSRKNLLGENNKWELVEKYSNERQVTADTPPTFFILADDDKTVPPRNSIEMYMAMKKYGIPAEMHIYSKGGHGFGMRRTDLPVGEWPKLFINWLKSKEIIPNK